MTALQDGEVHYFAIAIVADLAKSISGISPRAGQMANRGLTPQLCPANCRPSAQRQECFEVIGDISD